MKQYKVILISLIMLACNTAKAQFLMDMVDTTKEMGKDMLGIYERYNHIKFSGYIQTQFQIADTAGAKSFNGGDFSPFSNNRFMIRRGRMRIDYVRYTKNKKPSIQFIYQFDGSERGFFVRDFWGRVFDNKYELFSITTGMFARPFGYETNLSSADRESPERGRMNQTLIKIERDLGAMVSLDSRRNDHFLKYLKFDIGIFNGQGLNSTTDYDSHKDIISRLALKPFPLAKNLSISAAASYLNGGIFQYSKYRGSVSTDALGVSQFVMDSSRQGKIAPRTYYGLDAQLKLKHKWGATELRGELITGTQSASAQSTETPSAIVADLSINNAIYVRSFSGVYLYFLQNIVNRNNQVILKYDSYDPNTHVKGSDIGSINSNFTQADIKYQTFGIGFLHHFNDNLKVVFYYDKVKNEITNLANYNRDLKDNVFTTRLQYRF